MAALLAVALASVVAAGPRSYVSSWTSTEVSKSATTRALPVT